MRELLTSACSSLGLGVVIVAATLPLYVSGYVLGLLTSRFYSASSRWPGTCCSASPTK